MDTIFALASARGKSGVAVIRVSGPEAFAAGQALAGRLPEKRMSGLRRLTDLAGAPIDEALVLCFGADGSFTGEDVVEFQCHGSPAVIARLLDILGGLSGLRPAEPGEFTRRALENDRLDLARVEGLADLIEAETEAQRLQAFRVFDGALGAKVAEWRVDLVRALALIEATIDFADEEVPENVLPEVDALTAKVLASLREEHQGARLAERVREGFEVAILGPPNIGKSTLLNRLAGREAAITSEIAGTTRDVIEVRMDLDGLPVTFLDTAGLRETEDVVEAIGVARARERAASADLRIYLINGVLTETPEPEDIVVQGKSDLTGEGVSGLTGDGVSDLVARVSEVLSRRMSGAPVAIKARHRLAIEEGIDRIEAARGRLGTDDLVDLLAEDLRSAVVSLESLVGLVDVEHLLDEIFSSFCIGK